MGDGYAKGGFFFGAGFVQMNPLAVFGGFGEFVYAVLGYGEPLGGAEFLAD